MGILALHQQVGESKTISCQKKLATKPREQLENKGQDVVECVQKVESSRVALVAQLHPERDESRESTPKSPPSRHGPMGKQLTYRHDALKCCSSGPWSSSRQSVEMMWIVTGRRNTLQYLHTASVLSDFPVLHRERKWNHARLDRSPDNSDVSLLSRGRLVQAVTETFTRPANLHTRRSGVPGCAGAVVPSRAFAHAFQRTSKVGEFATTLNVVFSHATHGTPHWTLVCAAVIPMRRLRLVRPRILQTRRSSFGGRLLLTVSKSFCGWPARLVCQLLALRRCRTRPRTCRGEGRCSSPGHDQPRWSWVQTQPRMSCAVRLGKAPCWEAGILVMYWTCCTSQTEA